MGVECLLINSCIIFFTGCFPGSSGCAHSYFGQSPKSINSPEHLHHATSKCCLQIPQPSNMSLLCLTYINDSSVILYWKSICTVINVCWWFTEFQGLTINKEQERVKLPFNTKKPWARPGCDQAVTKTSCRWFQCHCHQLCWLLQVYAQMNPVLFKLSVIWGGRA